MLLVLSGCSRRPQSLHVEAPAYDAAAVATGVLELYDKNGDGQLSSQELQACDVIARHVESIDKDTNGAVSREEIEARVNSWIQSNTGLMQFMCTVTMGGKPLDGAQVELVPEPYLESLLTPATGTTDAAGMVALSVPTEQLPEAHRNFRMTQPGFYKVRITHPTVRVPARYNEQTTLGCEVSAETASFTTRVVFELKG